MTFNDFDLYSASRANFPQETFVDFKVDSLKLAKHLDITDSLGMLSVDPKYARQLLLKEPSEFLSGRVPLYVCACCADLYCGAVTVAVELIDNMVVWKNFGWEDPDSQDISQSEYMEHTGPFYFEKKPYRNVLYPYTRS
ncbi:hypothetical protein [Pleionea sp. CnH1-48]|uniref:hypothetical protein n=1 Tax=Pleionea sp. CnH1-48 TaxID=2954494 RepID=UPI00209788C7|nr:hypothetical protein [Pleionea sp. CnH1-48]MCO7225953.1 hypothetical protein [Pleionea sp. CnH1-48]